MTGSIHGRSRSLLTCINLPGGCWLEGDKLTLRSFSISWSFFNQQFPHFCEKYTHFILFFYSRLLFNKNSNNSFMKNNLNFTTSYLTLTKNNVTFNSKEIIFHLWLIIFNSKKSKHANKLTTNTWVVVYILCTRWKPAFNPIMPTAEEGGNVSAKILKAWCAKLFLFWHLA